MSSMPIIHCTTPDLSDFLSRIVVVDVPKNTKPSVLAKGIVDQFNSHDKESNSNWVQHISIPASPKFLSILFKPSYTCKKQAYILFDTSEHAAKAKEAGILVVGKPKSRHQKNDYLYRKLLGCTLNCHAFVPKVPDDVSVKSVMSLAMLTSSSFEYNQRVEDMRKVFHSIGLKTNLKEHDERDDQWSDDHSQDSICFVGITSQSVEMECALFALFEQSFDDNGLYKPLRAL
jgi:hypothetical protein